MVSVPVEFLTFAGGKPKLVQLAKQSKLSGLALTVVSKLAQELVSQPGQLVKKAGAVLGAAFASDPSMHYASGVTPPGAVANSLPSLSGVTATNLKQAHLARIARRICTDMVRYALHSPSCYLDLALVGGQELAGVAIWVAPGQHLSTWEMIRAGCWQWPLVMPVGVTLRSMRYSKVAEEYHATNMPEPHWYLYMLGVAPDYQRQGIGSALLQHGLNRADSGGQASYLESFNQTNLSLYYRQGFKLVATAHTPNERGPSSGCSKGLPASQ